MKKVLALCVASAALFLALPAGAATADKVQAEPSKAVAAAPPTATGHIVAKADVKKAKKGSKAGAKAKAKAKKTKAAIKPKAQVETKKT